MFRRSLVLCVATLLISCAALAAPTKRAKVATAAPSASSPVAPAARSSAFNASNGGVIENGKILVGAKFGFGSLGALGLGGVINGEYKLAVAGVPGLGVGGVVGYSHYGSGFAGYGFSNVVVMPQVTYHYDFLKNSKLDTYASTGLGIYFMSWDAGPAASSPYFAGVYTNTAGLAWSLYANARYFVTDSIAVTGSLGWGYGIALVGVDVKI